MNTSSEMLLSHLVTIPTLPAPSPDEQHAIAQTLAGDLNAFNELVTKYQNLAYSVAFRMLHTEDMAAHAVQDSFIKAYPALPSFNNGSFKSWLMRIVVNTCYDMLRSMRRYTLEEIGDDLDYEEGETAARQLVDGHELPQAFVERMELSAWLEAGLQALSVEHRLALALYDIHGYSYEEVSEITGAPLGTVKSRINRGRVKMRNFLLQQAECSSTRVE